MLRIPDAPLWRTSERVVENRSLKLGPIKITNRTVVGIDMQGRVAYYKRGMPPTSEILAAMSVVAS